MRPMLVPLAATLALAAPATAQQAVPGRELFDFPLGLAAEAPALAGDAAAGFWNPATLLLGAGTRHAVGVASLTTPLDQAVDAQLVTLRTTLPRGLTAGVSIARAEVGDLIHTETDPQSIGGEIPYSTVVLSAGLAGRYHGLTLGTALRRRTAQADGVYGQVTTVDVGVLVERVLGSPLRLAASTFLLSPRSRGTERRSLLAAVELPIVTHASWSTGAGASTVATEGTGRDDYLYLRGNVSVLELRAGLSRRTAYDVASYRSRLGLGLRYARYLVAVSREEGIGGLGASYQFLLSSLFK